MQNDMPDIMLSAYQNTYSIQLYAQQPLEFDEIFSPFLSIINRTRIQSYLYIHCQMDEEKIPPLERVDSDDEDAGSIYMSGGSEDDRSAAGSKADTELFDIHEEAVEDITNNFYEDVTKYYSFLDCPNVDKIRSTVEIVSPAVRYKLHQYVISSVAVFRAFIRNVRMNRSKYNIPDIAEFVICSSRFLPITSIEKYLSILRCMEKTDGKEYVNRDSLQKFICRYNSIRTIKCFGILNMEMMITNCSNKIFKHIITRVDPTPRLLSYCVFVKDKERVKLIKQIISDNLIFSTMESGKYALIDDLIKNNFITSQQAYNINMLKKSLDGGNVTLIVNQLKKASRSVIEQDKDLVAHPTIIFWLSSLP